jgi:hypothetical protein
VADISQKVSNEYAILLRGIQLTLVQYFS